MIINSTTLNRDLHSKKNMQKQQHTAPVRVKIT